MVLGSSKAAYLSKKYKTSSVGEDFFISHDEALRFLYDLCNSRASLIGIELYKHDKAESTLIWVGSTTFRGESYKTFLEAEKYVINKDFHCASFAFDLFDDYSRLEKMHKLRNIMSLEFDERIFLPPHDVNRFLSLCFNINISVSLEAISDTLEEDSGIKTANHFYNLENIAMQNKNGTVFYMNFGT